MSVANRTARSPRTVADLMHRDVVSASPGMSVRELARLLQRHRVGGVPVLDDDGAALGTVTVTDLLWLSDEVSPHALLEGRGWTELQGLTVREVMTPDAFGVPPTATLPELLTFFTRMGVHRALVMEDERVVGVVSMSDLLPLIAGADEGDQG